LNQNFFNKNAEVLSPPALGLFNGVLRSVNAITGSGTLCWFRAAESYNIAEITNSAM